MRYPFVLVFCLLCLGLGSTVQAQGPRRMVTQPTDESNLVRLSANTTPAARLAANDRGPVAEHMRLDHVLLLLKRDSRTEAEVQELIKALHDPKSAKFHHWLTPEEMGRRYGAHPRDVEAIQEWLRSRGFTINQAYRNGLVLDFAGTAKQMQEAFHMELHNLTLPNGDRHIANMSDPLIPAALQPAIAGVASLHNFFPRPRRTTPKPVSFDRKAQKWNAHFNVSQGSTLHVIAPFDFATIYNLLPLWQQGFTGKGVTIAVVEDSTLANPQDWSNFRQTFGLSGFSQGSFNQVNPGCQSPGPTGDETEAALDAEWASAAAPDAAILLSACADTQTTSGIDLAILGLLESNPPDIISVSYGLCETASGQAQIALENFEAELATAEGVTYFIAQGDSGADQCARTEATNYSIGGINSGDNTASAYAIDVGGTDFMAQYNSDVSGIPTSQYWGERNDPQTLASVKSYIPEIPWNDSCASRLIYSDPLIAGGFTQAFGYTGFCNSAIGQRYFLLTVAGGGGPSTCFTGTPVISGIVSGTCQGNPKPSFQIGIPGMPQDGVRDQPDISLFASNGAWGDFYPLCLSDLNQGGTDCTAENDAVMLGAGGTSFGAPAMAGIQALIDQRYGPQGNANYVYYTLAAQQFAQASAGGPMCDASQGNGNLPDAACVFNDVTQGDIATPCGAGYFGYIFNCHGTDRWNIGELSTSNDEDSPAFNAKPGYDLATGLGSVNAFNLFQAWAQFVAAPN